MRAYVQLLCEKLLIMFDQFVGLGFDMLFI